MDGGLAVCERTVGFSHDHYSWRDVYAAMHAAEEIAHA